MDCTGFVVRAANEFVFGQLAVVVGVTAFEPSSRGDASKRISAALSLIIIAVFTSKNPNCSKTRWISWCSNR